MEILRNFSFLFFQRKKWNWICWIKHFTRQIYSIYSIKFNPFLFTLTDWTLFCCWFQNFNLFLVPSNWKRKRRKIIGEQSGWSYVDILLSGKSENCEWKGERKSEGGGGGGRKKVKVELEREEKPKKKRKKKTKTKHKTIPFFHGQWFFDFSPWYFAMIYHTRLVSIS